MRYMTCWNHEQGSKSSHDPESGVVMQPFPLACMQCHGAALQAFEDTYKREFGFVLEQRSIIVDDLRVRATGKVS